MLEISIDKNNVLTVFKIDDEVSIRYDKDTIYEISKGGSNDHSITVFSDTYDKGITVLQDFLSKRIESLEKNLLIAKNTYAAVFNKAPHITKCEKHIDKAWAQAKLNKKLIPVKIDTYSDTTIIAMLHELGVTDKEINKHYNI